MRDVARAAGVSVSTVANILGRPEIVAPQTRRRVEAAIDDVGYVPNGPARQLRGVPSPIVGSITLDPANPFYAEVNRGIEDRMADEGRLPLAGSTDLRPAEERELLTLLRTQGVRGVVIGPAVRRSAAGRSPWPSPTDGRSARRGTRPSAPPHPS